MPIYLDHQEHGAHICYTEQDAQAHEQIGWVRRAEKKPEAPKQEAAQVIEMRRRGRPPKAHN